MEQFIMWLMATCALCGGADRILGNRLGLGEKFEQGFHLLGPTALSMAGILCLVPLLSRFLRSITAPACAFLGLDPAMFAGILAIDMGGYALCLQLAADEAVGRFAGVVVAATLGCTICFTIPVGMGLLDEKNRAEFSRGILFGLAALPLALLAGGLFCGLKLQQTLYQILPVLALSALLLWGLWRHTAGMVRGFGLLAKGIELITTLGLMLGAFTFITGVQLLPGLAPLEESMAVVASIGIVMLGSLPFAELLRRALHKPLAWVGRRTGMNSASIAALLLGAVSVLPAIALVSEMDARGKVVNAAFLVCAASGFAAHLGFVAGVDSAMILPMLGAKLIGGIAGALLALWATRLRPSSGR